MKTSHSFLLMSLYLISIFSCKNKEDDCLSHEICTGTSNYIPLAIGNYWIYEVVNYNTATHSGSIMPFSDTVEVIGISNINDHNYYAISSNRWSGERKDTLYWRDSLGYIVNDLGHIQFSETDFDRVLYHRHLGSTNNIYIDYRMRDSAVFELTPAGYFKCLDYEGTLWNNGVKDSRRIHNYFSKDVGIVYQNIFYVSGGPIELRRSLKEYYLE